MDEFKDVDREIENLKKQLNLGGTDSGVPFPEINDYWKRRLDEEKILSTKKLSAREEEKKALEFKINQQQTLIDQYLHTLKDLENKFDQETRGWEERLRIKEADLLVEKNRILNEEKVKEAEIEARRLLAQVAELNSKIACIKDEQEIEIQRLTENFAKERDAFNDKLKASAKQVEVLEQRIKELENGVKEKCAELEKVKADNDARLARSEQKNDALTADKGTLEKEKAALKAELDALKQMSEDEKRQIKVSLKNVSQNFVQGMRRGFGPLVGLAHFVSRHRVTPATWRIFEDLIRKVDVETDTFAMQANLSYIYNEPFTAVIALSDDEYAPWKSALLNTQAAAHCVAPKDIIKEIKKVKPQVAVVSARALRKAKAVRRRWPFLPVIISGQIDERKTRRLMAAGFSLIMPPYVVEEMVNVLSRSAGNSIAQPEYWGKIKIRRSYTPAIVAAGLLALAAVAVPVRKYADIPLDFHRVSSVATPYPQPTNLTFDGQYLWACDWLGQSIYKHRARGDNGILKIFYFPGRHFSALAWTKGNLWSMDPWEKKIYRHNSDANLSIVATYNAPGSAPSGLASDGVALWSCDAAAGMIYRHRPDDKLTVEASWKSPGTSPAGLCYDGKNLWSVDGKTNRIYRHNLDATLSVAAIYLPQEYEQKGYNISGIARGKNMFWICSEKAGRIFRYPETMLKKISG